MSTPLKFIEQEQIPLRASNMSLYHVTDRRILQDVVTCVREHTTLTIASRILGKGTELNSKNSEQMCWLFRYYLEVIHEAARLFFELQFSLDELRYEYLEETLGQSATLQVELERLT